MEEKAGVNTGLRSMLQKEKAELAKAGIQSWIDEAGGELYLYISPRDERVYRQWLRDKDRQKCTACRADAQAEWEIHDPGWILCPGCSREYDEKRLPPEKVLRLRQSARRDSPLLDFRYYDANGKRLSEKE